MKEVCRLVQEHGENILNVQNNDGNTPLHIACDDGNSDTVEALMCAGVKETITNDNGDCLLYTLLSSNI